MHCRKEQHSSRIRLTAVFIQCTVQCIYSTVLWCIFSALEHSIMYLLLFFSAHVSARGDLCCRFCTVCTVFAHVFKVETYFKEQCTLYCVPCVSPGRSLLHVCTAHTIVLVCLLSCISGGGCTTHSPTTMYISLFIWMAIDH